MLRGGEGDGHESASVFEAAWSPLAGELHRLAQRLSLFAVSSNPMDDLSDSQPKHDYTLFRMEDIWHWVVFTVVFFILVVFDNVVLHRKPEAVTFLRALLYTFFWIMCAVAFGCYIYFTRGWEDAFNWSTGYLLEWMLSVDNLFVFHLIFNLYATPDRLKHKPLFWGIVGAIIFRMIFFCIEEVLMHSFTFMHIVFGVFLIYTGIKTAMSDDEEEDPRKNRCFVWLSQRIRFINGYDDGGNFFVKVRLDPRTGEPILPELVASEVPKDGDGELDTGREAIPVYRSDGWYKGGPTESSLHPAYQWRATLLFLVVVCLEVTDVIFAVDSVSAIVAQIPDLYLAYTACVFAMLGLRALFFVVDELINMFSLLSYGVAFILIFIGVKLCLKTWIHVPPWIVCIILVSTLVGCMIASVIWDKIKASRDQGAAAG